MAYRFTLLGDGGTDAALKPVLEWVLSRADRARDEGFAVEFSLGRFGKPRHGALAGKIECALVEFPCDQLFVHRDSEGHDPRPRYAEIDAASRLTGFDRVVRVVPVRMTEAWLLLDEAAIRRVAGNPAGRVTLALPLVSRLEALSDPKQVCNDLMTTAADLTGRRRQKFTRDSELAWRRVRLASLIADFTPLLALDAFRDFHDRTLAACAALPPPGA